MEPKAHAVAPPLLSPDSYAPSPSFERLIERVREHCPEAARELYGQFNGRLRQYIRFRFSEKSLRRASAVPDLLQETWIAILISLGKGAHFVNEYAFFAFASKVADRRFGLFNRGRRKTAKRCVDREESLDAMKHDQPAFGADPADYAAVLDEWRFVLAALPPQYESLFNKLRSGIPLDKAAEEAGICKRSAERWLRRICQRVAERKTREAD